MDIVGFKTFMTQLVSAMEEDFSRWQDFQKMPRPAMHYPFGVIELMPISDDKAYAYKYVNGHPKNPEIGFPTVMATGQLADATTGYPLLISEMTILTACRTAATSALAAKYLAKRPAGAASFIGTGAQAEFQVLAFQALFDVKHVKYFDIDPAAMDKFEKNLADSGLDLQRCTSVQEAIVDTTIITTATASKQKVNILENEWIRPGVHINGIGGDCPGKTELDPNILDRAKVVVEFLDQSLIEGEVQHGGKEKVYAELWEIITGKKEGRTSDSEITLFDSVGFALEDYSTLRYVHQLAHEHGVGKDLDMVPEMADPKDLYGVLRS